MRHYYSGGKLLFTRCKNKHKESNLLSYLKRNVERIVYRQFIFTTYMSYCILTLTVTGIKGVVLSCP